MMDVEHLHNGLISKTDMFDSSLTYLLTKQIREWHDLDVGFQYQTLVMR